MIYKNKRKALLMKFYRVNKRTDNPGNHNEVHQEGCQHYDMVDYKALGQHSSCESALKEAKETYSKADCCHTCCNSCSKG